MGSATGREASRVSAAGSAANRASTAIDRHCGSPGHLRLRLRAQTNSIAGRPDRAVVGKRTFWLGRAAPSRRVFDGGCLDETVSRFRSHGSQGLLRFAHALDNLAAATRRRPSPGECQYPVLPLGDDGLAQNNFDPLRVDCGALDRVSYVILGRRVPLQTASLFVLRDRLVGAENAVVDVMVVDRDCCLNRQMRPDCARNPVFDL